MEYKFKKEGSCTNVSLYDVEHHDDEPVAEFSVFINKDKSFEIIRTDKWYGDDNHDFHPEEYDFKNEDGGEFFEYKEEINRFQ